jgi:hypothetical protein
MNNGERVFHRGVFYRTAPFGEWRDNHTRQHAGTDYGTHGKTLPQFSVLDRGQVFRIIAVESNGNQRGLLTDIRYDYADLGVIQQHLSAVSSKLRLEQFVDKTCAVGNTGMTGKFASGKKVSSGVHAHVEIYRISTGERMDFEKFNFDLLEQLHVAEARVLVARALKIPSVTVDDVNKLISHLNCYWNTSLRWVVEKLLDLDYSKAKYVDGSEAIYARAIKAVQIDKKDDYNNALLKYGENSVFYLIKKLLDAAGIA